MAHKFFPGQPVRPINTYGLPPGSGWYTDDWRFRVSFDSEAPGGFAIRPSRSFSQKLVVHLQVCQYEDYGNGDLKVQKQFQCWQWVEDFKNVDR
ncbi:hypothetical protein H6F86_20895 [Phormidium sp. FACHB-592]|uniref:SH2 domain-containing protein n=1 Tax=Stenomitos frigidus AS-A4 TaxID=2933935 RepID=A0ABV0KEM2_9CYAN|nr:hypothetical protein [Phormidium sp. FACHB-592]MBD2076292.1 hypothetical protein [Phormidium sp. FACHB-592]